MRFRNLSAIEDRQKILGGGVNQFHMSKLLKRLALHRAGATVSSRGFAVRFYLLHDRFPSALREQRVLDGQARLKHDLVETDIGRALPSGGSKNQLWTRSRSAASGCNSA